MYINKKKIRRKRKIGGAKRKLDDLNGIERVASTRKRYSPIACPPRPRNNDEFGDILINIINEQIAIENMRDYDDDNNMYGGSGTRRTTRAIRAKDKAAAAVEEEIEENMTGDKKEKNDLATAAAIATKVTATKIVSNNEKKELVNQGKEAIQKGKETSVALTPTSSPTSVQIIELVLLLGAIASGSYRAWCLAPEPVKQAFISMINQITGAGEGGIDFLKYATSDMWPEIQKTASLMWDRLGDTINSGLIATRISLRTWNTKPLQTFTQIITPVAKMLGYDQMSSFIIRALNDTEFKQNPSVTYKVVALTYGLTKKTVQLPVSFTKTLGSQFMYMATFMPESPIKAAGILVGNLLTMRRTFMEGVSEGMQKEAVAIGVEVGKEVKPIVEESRNLDDKEKSGEVVMVSQDNVEDAVEEKTKEVLDDIEKNPEKLDITEKQLEKNIEEKENESQTSQKQQTGGRKTYTKKRKLRKMKKRVSNTMKKKINKKNKNKKNKTKKK